MMIEPGRMKCLITGMRVSLDRFGTGMRNDRLDSRSTPPNTHWPSTRFPRLYFPRKPWEMWLSLRRTTVQLVYLRLPNLDSSISTTIPGPPIGSEFLITAWIATWRHRFVQAVVVLVDILNTFWISVRLSFFHHLTVIATFKTQIEELADAGIEPQTS